MRIEEALAGCRGLCDVPVLIAALGGEPRFVEISPGAWLGEAAGRCGVSAAAEVGRFGPLRCVALVAADPRDAADRIARMKARRGEPAFLVCLEVVPGAIAFAVATEPPAILAIDPDAPDGVGLASLRRLGELVGGGPMAVAARLGERLGGRRVDQRFFAAFRGMRDLFASEGPVAAPTGDRRGLALLQLTRVLFLYFIQQKGWLDGRSDFLAREVDRHLAAGRSLPRHLLRPLFFGSLGRPVPDRSPLVRRLGTVPFLNGGLFEPHPLERRWRYDHRNETWRRAFDELFERFHFTLDERGDGVAVAPDMLGRVFEGLMAEDERSSTGTFYTPVRLVDSLVTAGAASVLAERLGVERHLAEELIAARDPAAALALSRCRVLDPAVGSGAFLLGALELFAQLESARDPGIRHRRSILRGRLYGIDLSAEAVRLAELRLWLATVQEDPDGEAPEVDPLPNLDATVRQGDTLQDPHWLAGLRRVPRATALALGAARREFAGESGPGKKRAWRALHAAEQAAAGESLAEAEHDLHHRIHEILEDARASDLFGVRRGLDLPLRRTLKSARADRRRVRDAQRRLMREGALPWFDAHSAFGEVFAERGGFDLVVGNPPWVRSEELPPRTREILARRYRWWRGGHATGFGHLPDLAVAFVERSLELTAPGGAVAMLLPAKLATSGYGTEMRAALAGNSTLDQIIDLGANAADAFAAVTYPLALVARKRSPAPGHSIQLREDGSLTSPQVGWSGAPWILKDPDAGRLAADLRARHPLLADEVPIHLGIKCGLNVAYLDPPEWVEPELVRRAVRGRDLDPFEVKATVRLLYPHDGSGRPLGTLPPGALRHLSRSRRPLIARADAANGPWWSLHRTAPASAPHRVAWPDLSRRIEAVALPRDLLPLNSCYLAAVKGNSAAHSLASWLNAGWIRALARLGADPARGGYSRFNSRTIGALPWPTAAREDRRLTELGGAGSATKERQDAIDRIVADLLGLDARDRGALRALA